MPGDHPDPSVVKIGDTYWAFSYHLELVSSLSASKIKDLVNWEPQGYVFDKMPGWTDYYFWGAEIPMKMER